MNPAVKRLSFGYHSRAMQPTVRATFLCERSWEGKNEQGKAGVGGVLPGTAPGTHPVSIVSQLGQSSCAW
jgi:hypothetical protein